MAGTSQILQRRKAVENIRRITRTMEMISTARYKSYSNKRAAIVDYHDALARAGYLLVSSQTPIHHPLLKENKSGKWGILVLGSSRGLCGQFNASVYRMLDVHVNRAKSLNKNLEIYATQSKLLGSLSYHHITPAKVYTGFEDVPPDSLIEQMASDLISRYKAGQIDFFGIVYMNFYSVTNQQAQTLAIMPLIELIDDLATRAKAIWPWKTSFEDFYISPSADEVIEGLASMIIQYSIKSCFMSSAISEHVARMIAMRNATDNADDMIKELTGEYNRARQSKITAELLDIIGGTGVLE
jgi:F-type H+-transporting ATPase subunit gamma